ncbi:MAG: hypothetical protein ABIQ64_03005 [Candidatus Saccharimonadales bacterium]
MAVSELCPETGEICQARQWLQEIEALIVTERHDSDDIFTGDSIGQKALRLWDITGGHRRDRNRALDRDVHWIADAVKEHERLAADGVKKCEGSFCASMAQVVLRSDSI